MIASIQLLARALFPHVHLHAPASACSISRRVNMLRSTATHLLLCAGQLLKLQAAQLGLCRSRNRNVVLNYLNRGLVSRHRLARRCDLLSLKMPRQQRAAASFRQFFSRTALTRARITGAVQPTRRCFAISGTAPATAASPCSCTLHRVQCCLP